MLVDAQFEFSFQKLDSVELEPLTFQDFDTIQQHGDFIEENLLNQMQVFYRDQLFVIHLQGNQSVRLKTIIK